MELVRASRRYSSALRRFQCGSDVPYEREVEDYIQGHVPAHLHRGVLLLISGRDLVGVGEHEAQPDPYGTGRTVSYLKVLAIESGWQGRDTEGMSAANLLLSALINDALRSGREPLVTALIDEDNERAQRLVKRPPFEFREVPPKVPGFRRDGTAAVYLFFERRYEALGRT